MLKVNVTLFLCLNYKVLLINILNILIKKLKIYIYYINNKKT